MNNITEPLRLAVGSHGAGSGAGCAMNVISWENGDSTITDFPQCSDPFLARLIQRVNDSYCTHRNNTKFLCPDCSIKVLELGHRTVGTNLLATHTAKEQANIYAAIAKWEADSVKNLKSAAADAASYAAVAASYAPDAAVAVAASYVAVAASYAVDAAAVASYAADRVERAHKTIDKFYELTGLVEKAAPPVEVVNNAVVCMLVKS